QDVLDLKKVVHTELNIEGYPSAAFLDLVTQVRPNQCTLVPDPPGALTSSTGWDTLAQQPLLSEVVGRLKQAGIRVSIFLDPKKELVAGAKLCGADRIELYTGPYAHAYEQAKTQPQDFKLYRAYKETADEALRVGLALNAGHDLNLENLKYFKLHIPQLQEVSIGHALICDALYFGLEQTIGMYKRLLTDHE
ncbi:MAG TPA: pyridoxine 5'-phosphate synthase, partial [Chitinophagaceae bacterium]|nr:pyridoxine 5'-phosphate synthase [Chitinophagaceae bacterium]